MSAFYSSFKTTKFLHPFRLDLHGPITLMKWLQLVFDITVVSFNGVGGLLVTGLSSL